MQCNAKHIWTSKQRCQAGSAPQGQGSFFNIKNQHSGLYLGVREASENNGADIIQWTKADDGSQEWLILAAEQGPYVKVLNPHSRKVWGIANSSSNPGETLIQWTPLNVDDQEWQLDIL